MSGLRPPALLATAAMCLVHVHAWGADLKAPAWMMGCPPFCDGSGLFGQVPAAPPGSWEKEPVEAPPAFQPAEGTAGPPEGGPPTPDVAVPIRPKPEADERQAEIPDVDPPFVVEGAERTEIGRNRSEETGAAPAISDAIDVPVRPVRPPGDLPAGTAAALERPTPALDKQRVDPPSKLPVPPRKPAAVPRRTGQREVASAVPVRPRPRKEKPEESLIKPVEPIADPRFPADAMVKTHWGIPDLTRDGFQIKAFDGRNRVFLQKGSAVGLCRFDSVAIAVDGGSYVGNYECYVTQRSLRP